MDSSNDSPTDGNCPEISEDRKSILSLLTNDSNNVPNSRSTKTTRDKKNNVSNSRSTKTTRDKKNWFPYRPRTRLAKKRLSLDVIVVSSDSEGSDVECNSNELEIVQKTEIVSEDSALEVVSRVSVTGDHFAKQEMQQDSYCTNDNDSTGAAINQNNISDLRSNDDYVQSVEDTNERMLGKNIGTAPVVQNDDLPFADDDDKSTPSASSKSQDESNTGSSEYEREYSQQPLESDDKLLKRLKRRLSTSDSINQAAVIPEKRERTEL